MQHLKAKNKHVHPGIRKAIKLLRGGDNNVSELGPSRNPGTKGCCNLCLMS